MWSEVTILRISNKVAEAISSAANYCTDNTQREMLKGFGKKFFSGDIETYKGTIKLWMKNTRPNVETIIGFVETHRDPYGVRAEFEGIVAISDPDGSRALDTLVKRSQEFLSRLPWVQNAAGDGKNGPYERNIHVAPGFSWVYGLSIDLASVSVVSC